MEVVGDFFGLVGDHSLFCAMAEFCKSFLGVSRLFLELRKIVN